MKILNYVEAYFYSYFFIMQHVKFELIHILEWQKLSIFHKVEIKTNLKISLKQKINLLEKF